MRCAVAFLFKTLERAVERSNRQRPSGPGFDFVTNRHAIAALAEPQDREKNELFEFTEISAFGDYVLNSRTNTRDMKKVHRILRREVASM